MSLKTNIIVYSTHCPQCIMLTKLLDEKEIQYSVIDNETEVKAAAVKADIKSVPFCNVSGELKTFQEMINYINSL